MGTKDQLLLAHHRSSIPIRVNNETNKTYLVVSNRSEVLVGDVLSDGWNSEGAVLVFVFAHNVSGTWLD